jgi:hypothetical protein
MESPAAWIRGKVLLVGLTVDVLEFEPAAFRPVTSRFHDPGPRVEPDPVVGCMRGKRPL